MIGIHATSAGAIAGVGSVSDAADGAYCRLFDVFLWKHAIIKYSISDIVACFLAGLLFSILKVPKPKSVLMIKLAIYHAKGARAAIRAAMEMHSVYGEVRRVNRIQVCLVLAFASFMPLITSLTFHVKLVKAFIYCTVSSLHISGCARAFTRELALLQALATIVAMHDQQENIYAFVKWMRDYGKQVESAQDIPDPADVRHVERQWVLVDWSEKPVTTENVVRLYGHRTTVRLARSLEVEYQRSHASDQSTDPPGSIRSDASALSADKGEPHNKVVV